MAICISTGAAAAAPTNAAHERAGHLWLGVGPARRPFFYMLQAWKHPLDRHHCHRRALNPMSLSPARWSSSVERACVAVVIAVDEGFRLDLDGDAVLAIAEA